MNLEKKSCMHDAPFETKGSCPVCRRVALRCVHDRPYEGENMCPICGPAFESGFEQAAQSIADFVGSGQTGSIKVYDKGVSEILIENPVPEPVHTSTARVIRRAFVRAPYVRSGELFQPIGGKFRVIKVDPEGSGLDWNGHLGKIITGAERCCERCTVIFGYLHHHEIGPFVRGELEPLDAEARRIHGTIEAFAREKGGA